MSSLTAKTLMHSPGKPSKAHWGRLMEEGRVGSSRGRFSSAREGTGGPALPKHESGDRATARWCTGCYASLAHFVFTSWARSPLSSQLGSSPQTPWVWEEQRGLAWLGRVQQHLRGREGMAGLSLPLEMPRGVWIWPECGCPYACTTGRVPVPPVGNPWGPVAAAPAPPTRSPALQTPPAQGTPLPVLPSPAAEGSDGQRASEGSKGSGPEHSCSACHRGGCGSGSLVKWGPGSGGPNAGERFSFSFPPLFLSLFYKYMGFTSCPKPLQDTDRSSPARGHTEERRTGTGDSDAARCCLSVPEWTRADTLAIPGPLRTARQHR